MANLINEDLNLQIKNLVVVCETYKEAQFIFNLYVDWCYENGSNLLNIGYSKIVSHDFPTTSLYLSNGWTVTFIEEGYEEYFSHYINLLYIKVEDFYEIGGLFAKNT